MQIFGVTLVRLLDAFHGQGENKSVRQAILDAVADRRPVVDPKTGKPAHHPELSAPPWVAVPELYIPVPITHHANLATAPDITPRPSTDDAENTAPAAIQERKDETAPVKFLLLSPEHAADLRKRGAHNTNPKGDLFPGGLILTPDLYGNYKSLTTVNKSQTIKTLKKISTPTSVNGDTAPKLVPINIKSVYIPTHQAKAIGDLLGIQPSLEKIEDARVPLPFKTLIPPESMYPLDTRSTPSAIHYLYRLSRTCFPTMEHLNLSKLSGLHVTSPNRLLDIIDLSGTLEKFKKNIRLAKLTVDNPDIFKNYPVTRDDFQVLRRLCSEMAETWKMNYIRGEKTLSIENDFLYGESGSKVAIQIIDPSRDTSYLLRDSQNLSEETYLLIERFRTAHHAALQKEHEHKVRGFPFLSDRLIIVISVARSFYKRLLETPRSQGLATQVAKKLEAHWPKAASPNETTQKYSTAKEIELARKIILYRPEQFSNRVASKRDEQASKR